MDRIEHLTGKIIDLKLTDDELERERDGFPFGYIVREDKTMTYQLVSSNKVDEEIDDLPDNITDILTKHINNHKKGNLDETGREVLTIDNFYCKEKNPSGGIFLRTLVKLPGVRGSWGELEYKEDKMLSIDFRCWPEDGYSVNKEEGMLLIIEDRYETIYVDYNRQIEYLDPKIDLDRLLECLKNKVM